MRTGPLKSSRLLARKLGVTRMVIVGAPAYLERQGMPIHLADLERHNRLGFNYTQAMEGWPLLDQGQTINVATTGNAQVSDGSFWADYVLNRRRIGKPPRTAGESRMSPSRQHSHRDSPRGLSCPPLRCRTVHG